jgi:fucose permease
VTSIDKALFTNNVAMLLYGLSAVLIGPTLPGMIASFDLTLGQAGFIGAMQNAGGIVGALVALFVADRVSHTKSAVVSFALLGIALFTVGVSRSYSVVLVTFACTGLFIRIMDVMLNAGTGDFAVVRVRSDRAGTATSGAAPANRSGRDLSTLHMFFSVGAFAGPVAARAIMGAGMSWWQVFRWTGLAYLVVVLAGSGWLRRYVRISAAQDHGRARGTGRGSGTGTGSGPGSGSGRGSSDGHGTGASSRADAARLAVPIMGGLFFFYAIHQVGITSWVPYFLETARGAGPGTASMGLSAYWVGIIGGRFLSSRLVEPVGAHPILLGGCLVSAVATLLAVLVPHPSAAQILLLASGVAGGATIPLGYSVAYQFDPSRTGSVTAFLAIIMLAGRFLGPWMVGLAADRIGLVGAMTITGWSLFFSGALAGVVWMLHRRAAVSGQRSISV